MRDVGLAPNNELPAAERAVTYLVRRIQNDPDLAYLISPGTGMHDVLLDALAEMYPGEDGAIALRCRETHRRARLVEYPERIDQLERLLDEHGIGAPR